MTDPSAPIDPAQLRVDADTANPIDSVVEDPELVYPVHLTEEVHRKFESAIRRAAGTERVVWEIYPTGWPNPTKPNTMVTALCLYMNMPSATNLGQSLTLSLVMDPGIVVAPQEVIDEFARERINEMLAVRSQELVEMQQQAAQAAAAGNGGPAGTEGLLFPGRG